MASVNEHIVYQPDDRPGHPISALHGFQEVMTRVAGMAASVSIVALAVGQSEGYLHWILFSALVICGVGHILQTQQFWRFGSGYPLSVASSSAFIGIGISALSAGGPVMLSALMTVTSLVQFAFISRLSLLRRIITPMVAGGVMMLLTATVIPIVLTRISKVPEGVPSTTAPLLAGTTLFMLMGLRLFAPGQGAAIRSRLRDSGGLRPSRALRFLQLSGND